MSCSLTSVSWCLVQRQIQECFWELRAGDIWEGADGSRGGNTWEFGGDCREKAMGRGAKLLSGSGWQWAGSLQLWLAVEASCGEGGRFHPSALFSPFHSLNPFTSYKLRVKATNDIGDSDFSAETEAVTTLQDGKGGGEAHWGHH